MFSDRFILRFLSKSVFEAFPLPAHHLCSCWFAQKEDPGGRARSIVFAATCDGGKTLAERRSGDATWPERVRKI